MITVPHNAVLEPPMAGTPAYRASSTQPHKGNPGMWLIISPADLPNNCWISPLRIPVVQKHLGTPTHWPWHCDSVRLCLQGSLLVQELANHFRFLIFECDGAVQPSCSQVTFFLWTWDCPCLYLHHTCFEGQKQYITYL